ncbi:MAG TPA: glycosyltransferase family 1 protein [Thioploca sp.]|nr:glycosyltransferase family 1 protein [Thioploca sp.]
MKQVLIFKFPYSSLYGGGEKHTTLLVNELGKKGFVFHLVSSCPVLLQEFKKRKWSWKKTWAGKEPVSKGALLIWPLVAPFVFVNLFRILLSYRIKKKVTVLYCQSLTEKILATLPARMIGMKVIWIEHVTVERWLTKNPLRIFYRLFSRFVTIVVISRVIKEQLVQDIKIDKNKIEVVYNGIDLDVFVMKNRRWENTARFNIGCVARLEKEKGIEFLIQAIKIVREFIPFARLIIVGEGSERKKLQWLAERLELKEAVQWVGHQEEIQKWYGYFDVYVLPSVTRESFGITLVEAMASGLPVIASRIGGTPEVIDHNKDGLLAEPGNSQDIADKLLYLFNNRSKTQEMVTTARSKVEERFSLERMARDFYLLFRK